MHTDARPTCNPPLQADDLVGSVETRMASLIGANRRLRSEATRAGLNHLAAGGRRMRARLALHAAVALRLGAGDAVALACAAELLHNASLIHDDLQDRDDLRRNRPSVWRAFGDAAAICTGDLLLSAAYAALAGFAGRDAGFAGRDALPSLIALAHARVAGAIDGQCTDVAPEFATLDHYGQVVRSKSGALLALPLELALIGAGRIDAAGMARTAAENFALAYQIADDLADVSGDEVRGSLNIVSVLRAAHGATAGRVARGLALRHLADAMAGALALPDGSGTLLGSLAMRLSATL